MSGKTIHYCNVCDYKTTRRWDRDRHFQKKHAQSVPPRAPTTMSVDSRFQPYPTNHASHTTNTAQVVQKGCGVPQAVSTELFNRYRNALVNAIREKEDLRNENIELVRHRDEILDKMSNDFSRLYHRYKDSRKEVKEILKC